MHLSGYFEPNSTLEDGMYGDELDEMEEDDDESDDSEEEVSLEKLEKLKGKQDAKKNGVKDIKGFEKGGDLEKSLKSAK